MATVTLPYPNIDFVPLDILTAAEQNMLVANINYLADFSNGLADGSNLSNGIIQPRHIKFADFDNTEFPVVAVNTNNSNVNSDTSYDQYTHTITKAGLYFMVFSQRMTNGQNNYDFQTNITVNGTQVVSSGNGGATYVNYITAYSVYAARLSVGDVIKCRSRGGGQGSFTTQQGRFTLIRVF